MNNTTSPRLPAEWEQQSGVMLTWPHDGTDWVDVLNEVEPVFVNIAKAVSARENLLIVARDPAHRDHVNGLLVSAGANMDKVHLYGIASNDTWARDHGPISVFENNKPVLLDFQFNGWGNKFAAELDNAISGHLSEQGAFGSSAMRRIGIFLEGGSIDSDGQGVILTTSECLLAPTRNPELDRQAVEEELRKLFGSTRVHWLDHGMLLGDDTDSHIDMLARFCDPQTICYMQCTDKTDPHYDALYAMEAELRALRQPSGEPYRLVALPLPSAMYDADGQRVPGSYCNFLIINGAVLLPIYGVTEDDVAIALLGECFPGREIVPIQCRPLIDQHGSLHCLTMQFPAGVLPG